MADICIMEILLMIYFLFVKFICGLLLGECTVELNKSLKTNTAKFVPKLYRVKVESSNFRSLCVYLNNIRLRNSCHLRFSNINNQM